jgi:hypothetical protein
MLREGVRRGEVGVLSCAVYSTTIKDGAELRVPATLSVPPSAQGHSPDGGSDGGEQREANEKKQSFRDEATVGLYQVSQ